MAAGREPSTLVKAGRYDYPLEEAVKKLSEQLVPVTFGLGNTVKYAMFNKERVHYLLMVSQQVNRKVTPEGYNILLSVTSYSQNRNQEVAQRFEKETGIDLSMDIPERLKMQYAMMRYAFHAFEINPEAAMAILTDKRLN